MGAPTPSTDRLLAFLKAEVAAKGEFPTRYAIAKHMGWKGTTGVNDALMRLRQRGEIRVKSRAPSSTGWRYEWELDVAPPISGRAAAVEAPSAEDVDPKSSIAARAERVKEDA
jgi:SOS-response transcriptional repressor LexA